VPKLREANSSRGRPGFAKAYGSGLVTGALFLLSWTGQFFTQLLTVRNESAQHDQPFEERGIDPAAVSAEVNRSV
jgi:hypothetical protein